MCRFPFVKEWFNEMQTAKNGESKRETSEAYLGLKKKREKNDETIGDFYSSPRQFLSLQK